jgi:hypothetical protein
LRACDEAVCFGETSGDSGFVPVDNAVAVPGLGTGSRDNADEFAGLCEFIRHECLLLISEPPEQLSAGTRITVPSLAVTISGRCTADLLRGSRDPCAR